MNMLFAACVLSATILLDGMPPARPVASCSAPGKIMQLSQARAAAYVPAVSGDPELDAYLKTVLDGVVGRDGDALRRAYEWLGSYEAFPYEEMDYIDVAAPDGEWSVDCALEMAQRGSGNCYRYAALMSWIARALGYDAEAVSGLVLMADGWAYHGWVEVHMEDGTTLIIDAQQHAREWNAGHDFFMVTYEDSPLYYAKSWDEAW